MEGKLYGKDSFQGKENHGKFRFVEKSIRRHNLAEQKTQQPLTNFLCKEENLVMN